MTCEMPARHVHAWKLKHQWCAGRWKGSAEGGAKDTISHQARSTSSTAAQARPAAASEGLQALPITRVPDRVIRHS